MQFNSEVKQALACLLLLGVFLLLASREKQRHPTLLRVPRCTCGRGAVSGAAYLPPCPIPLRVACLLLASHLKLFPVLLLVLCFLLASRLLRFRTLAAGCRQAAVSRPIPMMVLHGSSFPQHLPSKHCQSKAESATDQSLHTARICSQVDFPIAMEDGATTLVVPRC